MKTIFAKMCYMMRYCIVIYSVDCI